MIKSGLLCILITSVFSCFIGMGVKSLGNIPALQIILIRSVVSLFAGLLIIRKLKISPLGKKENFPVLCARGLLGTVGIGLYFYTLKEIDFGEAVTIQHLSPVFTAVIALILLKEKGSV